MQREPHEHHPHNGNNPLPRRCGWCLDDDAMNLLNDKEREELMQEPQTPREFILQQRVRELEYRCRASESLSSLMESTSPLGPEAPPIKGRGEIVNFKARIKATMARNNGGYHFHTVGRGDDGAYELTYFLSEETTVRTFDLRVTMAHFLRQMVTELLRNNGVRP